MPENDQLDLILKGGHLIDPANQIDAGRDVGIKDGKIARVAEEIPPGDAPRSIDLSGLFITPGLIDMHLHAYHTRDLVPGAWSDSLHPDAHFLKEGVTTCVDTGTAGWQEMDHFRESVIDRSTIRVLAYVNIAGAGMGAPEQIVAGFDPARTAAAASAHREAVVGIKSAHYWAGEFDADHPPWASAEKAVEAGALCQMPVMIDFAQRLPERPYSQLVLEKLRPGDIHTHVYAKHTPVVDEAGEVFDYMYQARERGVLFDLGHGAGSFWLRHAARAIAQGFPPDTISTDLHLANIHGHVNSMMDVMSKCLAMGMPLQEVVYRSTLTPAQALHRPELGTLSVGAEADIAVLELRPGSFAFRDCGWARIDADQRLECLLTLRRGEVVWDRHALTCPHWEEAPESYWTPDGPQRLWRAH